MQYQLQVVSYSSIVSDLTIIFVVSANWNGSTITGPLLIYHDEIVSDTTIPTVENSDGPGDLVCRSENHEAAHWRNPDGHTVPTSGNYRRVKSASGLPSLSQLYTPNELTGSNVHGLWICQVINPGSNILERDILDSFNYVGIYNRGDGE